MSYGLMIGNCLIESSKQLHSHYIDVSIEVEPGCFKPVISGELTDCFTEDEVQKIQNSETMFETMADILTNEYPYLMKEYKNKGDLKNMEQECTRRYAIVVGTEDGTTETLEDYDTATQALAALESIRINGYHLPENYSLIDQDKITFEDRGNLTLALEAEVWDHKMNHIGFEPILHTPIHIFNGMVVKSETDENKEAMTYLRKSTIERQPLLSKKIAEIKEWKNTFENTLTGENTLICTLDNEERIFHVIADNTLKIVEQVDGNLTGINLYSPERAAEVAKHVKLNGDGAPGLSVKSVNMGEFQNEMLCRTERMLKTDASLLKYFQIQDLAANATPGLSLSDLVAAVNKSTSPNLKV